MTINNVAPKTKCKFCGKMSLHRDGIDTACAYCGEPFNALRAKVERIIETHQQKEAK